MRCFIALGGNLGDVASTLCAAWGLLGGIDRLRPVRLSSFFVTEAVGDAAGSRFLNAAGELETSLDPLSLLDALQGVEAALGRTRDVRWGPRTLDLDLILWGDAIIDHPRLTVPHPACWYRRFVLDPLAEIAPGIRHPVWGRSIEELRRRLLFRPLPVTLLGDDGDAVRRALEPRFPDARFVLEEATHDHGLRIALGAETKGPHAAAPAEVPTVRLPRSDFDAVVTAVRHVLESAMAAPVRQSPAERAASS